MSETFNAFEISPVPAPGPDAVAPELFRGIYGMPMFITLPCPDLSASLAYWTGTLGFFELFSIPGRLVHLRRWAFQDVLLVPGASDTGATPAGVQPLVSFACVLGELDGLAQACRASSAGALTKLWDTPWNTRDLEVMTPEGARVVFTAAKAWEQGSDEARNLDAIGIRPPVAD